jgi:hypothetical protein
MLKQSLFNIIIIIIHTLMDPLLFGYEEPLQSGTYRNLKGAGRRPRRFRPLDLRGKTCRHIFHSPFFRNNKNRFSPGLNACSAASLLFTSWYAAHTVPPGTYRTLARSRYRGKQFCNLLGSLGLSNQAAGPAPRPG